MWSGDAGIAKTRAEEANNGVNIEYSIPKEGALLWFDMMAMPTDAPNPDNAYTFLNYLLEPEVMAKISNFVTYPNAVPASLAADRRGGEGRPEPVPDARGQGEPVHGDALRPEGAAHRDPALDQARHRQLSAASGRGR